MNILLLNLTRFGDLLQSQVAVNDLAAQGHKVAVVCLENFAGAGALLAGTTHVFPLQSAELLDCLAKDGAGQNTGAETPDRGWHRALAGLSAWRDELYSFFTPDMICNLTPTLPARMLAFFLARGGAVAGFGVDEGGFGIHGNAWAAFLQGAAASRQVTSFNVADLFRRIAAPDNGNERPALQGDAALKPPPEAKVSAMAASLRAKAPAECKGFVALQMGASEARRRWPVASFAALGDRLWQEEKLCPVLLGNAAEAGLAERYAHAARHPHISLCGRTNFEDLACALVCARMLVSNDTGTMHLAAGLGVPVLAIFLATAQPFDTGPYLADSCCVEPDMACHPCAFGVACPHQEVCRAAIGPESLASLALARLRHGHWQPPAGGEGAAPAGVRIWQSEFDRAGFISLRSLSGHGNCARAAWLTLQRPFLRAYLDRQPERMPGLSAGNIRLPEAERLAIAASLEQAAKLVDLLQQQGRVFLERPLPLLRDRVLSTWQKVHDTLRGNPCCGALALVWMQDTQTAGQDLPAILASSGRFGGLLQAILQQLTYNTNEK